MPSSPEQIQKLMESIGPAVLVVWIVVLVKFSGLKGQIVQA